MGASKQTVLKRLKKELALQGEELCVLNAAQAAEAPGDPHSSVVLLATRDDESRHRWQAWRCPEGFSWIRCGQLALSATPQGCHLESLEILGLSKLVHAEPGRPRPLQEHLEESIGEIAKALGQGAGCLVHCADGFGASGVVGAC